MVGAVPHCYLLLVFLGQLELCPLAFPGLTSCCLLTMEALQSRLNPSVGNGLLMVTVYSCARCPLPPIQPIFLVFVK